MFKYLIKGILAGVAVKLLDNYRHLSVQLLKIEAAYEKKVDREKRTKKSQPPAETT